MDIFTTQLTRIVPVPIKPASLKVKALLKEAANSKLNQDPNHLENHEYYFTHEEDQYHNSEQQKQEPKKAKENTSELNIQGDDVELEKEPPKSKHLDLYA